MQVLARKIPSSSRSLSDPAIARAGVVARKYLTTYHEERANQGLDGRVIRPGPTLAARPVRRETASCAAARRGTKRSEGANVSAACCGTTIAPRPDSNLPPFARQSRSTPGPLPRAWISPTSTALVSLPPSSEHLWPEMITRGCLDKLDHHQPQR